MRARAASFSVIVLAGLSLLAGCTSKGKSVEWSGQITFQGKPVESGSIRFEPMEKGGQSAGASISAGRYQVSLAPGKYQVEVRAFEKTGETPAYEGRSEMIPIMSPIAEYKEAVEVSTSTTRDFELSKQQTPR